MGIHAKYDLTKYAFQTVEPKCHYSVDRYIVSSFDGYETYNTNHDTWLEATSHYKALLEVNSEQDFEDQISITGLVFN